MVGRIASQLPAEPVPDELIHAATGRSAGRLFKVVKVGGKFLMVVAIAADTYEVYQADFHPRVITKKVGAWSGSLWAGGIAAGEASPLTAAGPWGWAGYVVIVGGSGFVGYCAGGEIPEQIYTWTFE